MCNFAYNKATNNAVMICNADSDPKKQTMNRALFNEKKLRKVSKSEDFLLDKCGNVRAIRYDINDVHDDTSQ